MSKWQLLTLIVLLANMFMVGFAVGSFVEHSRQATIPNWIGWTHTNDLTPATQEYLEAHPDIADPNR